jgi:hypothetical protein
MNSFQPRILVHVCLWLSVIFLLWISSEGKSFAELPAKAKGAATDSSFLRIHKPADEVLELQIALVKLRPMADREGPVIWLAGVSHIGEREYYADLQKHLDSQSLVLFEGIDGGELKKSERASAGAKQSTGSIQSSLAKALGLVFQLDAIDYSREHFQNSDLTLNQLQTLLGGEKSNRAVSPQRSSAARAEPADEIQEEFERLLSLMDESSWTGQLMGTVFQWLGANPRWQAIARFLLIEILGNMQGDMAQFENLPPAMKHLLEVLLHARNNAVLEDLELALKGENPPPSISLFYGAAHMAHFQQSIEERFRYSREKEVWLTAFSVNLEKAGLSQMDLQWLSSLIRRHMAQLQGTGMQP